METLLRSSATHAEIYYPLGYVVIRAFRTTAQYQDGMITITTHLKPSDDLQYTSLQSLKRYFNSLSSIVFRDNRIVQQYADFHYLLTDPEPKMQLTLHIPTKRHGKEATVMTLPLDSIGVKDFKFFLHVEHLPNYISHQ